MFLLARNSAGFILLAIALFIIPEKTYGQNWKYDNSKIKRLRIIRSFITNTKYAGRAQPISTIVRPGQKINFYYKIGPIKVIRGKGAPYQSRLLIKRGNRIVKRFRWHRMNAVRGRNMQRTITFGWYHNSQWYLKIPKTIPFDTYTALLTHRDNNSQSSVSIRYRFTIKENIKKYDENNSFKNNSRTNMSEHDQLIQFAKSFKQKRLSQVMSYVGNSTDFQTCLRGRKSKQEAKDRLKYMIRANYRYHTVTVTKRYLIVKLQKTRGTLSASDTPLIFYFMRKDGKLIISQISKGCQG